MSAIHRHLLLIFGGLGLNAPAPLVAAPPGVPALERGAGPTSPSRTPEAESLDQKTAKRMWRLTVALKLDPTAAAKLFPLVEQYEQSKRALMRERGALTAELRRQIGAKVSHDDDLRKVIDRVLANGRQRRTLELRLFESLRPLLSVDQQAKFLVLFPRLRRDDHFRGPRPRLP